MAIEKPYRLIIRPFINQSPDRFDYISDKSGISAFRGYIRAFELLEKDLVELFDYIEPCDNNGNTYSHRIYELYLRACTEFEANAKIVLSSNGYMNAKNISDYWKLNEAMKLSDYLVKINIWDGTNAIIKPYEEWSTNNKSLSWYQDYNKVKHDRNRFFKLASLSNLVKAISAIRIILYAQYDFISFNSYHDIGFLSERDGFISRDESIFSIKFNGHWNDEEKYDFNWNTLSTTVDPYQTFNFNI